MPRLLWGEIGGRNFTPSLKKRKQKRKAQKEAQRKNRKK